MNLSMRIGCATLLLLGVSVAARAAEQVDNPMYAAWAKFKPGATVTLTGTIELGALSTEGPTKMDQEITYELVEVKPEQVLLRLTTRVWLNRRESAFPPQMVSYPAKTDKETDGVISMNDGNPKVKRTFKKLEVGKDKYDYNGRTVEAVTREYTFELVDQDVPGQVTVMTTKAWFLPDIPGGMVKVESIGMGILQTNTKMQMTNWRSPR